MRTRRPHGGTEPDADRKPSTGPADRLRERTHGLHGIAERSGFIHALLGGTATPGGYAIYLRNLLPAYLAMEEGLETHRDTDAVGRLAMREVYRAGAMKSDLTALCGSDWASALPLLPAGASYAACIVRAAEGDGARLLGHAYVRYLGDLNGGRVMMGRLSESLNLPRSALSFYIYGGIPDLKAFRVAYRARLDQAASRLDLDPVLDEAVTAFEWNIELSRDVQRYLEGIAPPGTP
jgi:heme oxygenase